MNNNYKKYTLQARMCVKGEAFFESLASEHSLPHHIISPKDVGIDYICEWIYGDKPTGVLYAVQIKTLSEEYANPKFMEVAEGYNGLSTFEIHNPHLKIEESTLQYWRGLGMPVYLFAIIQSNAESGEEKLDCYYKRYTPILTKAIEYSAKNFHNEFYKVNNGNSFIAFKDKVNRTQGFVRDLFIDHVRWCYYKGSVTYLDPRALGLEQFKSEGIFGDLFKDYEEQICSVYNKTGQYLKRLGIRREA